jgi:hypothetical protein
MEEEKKARVKRVALVGEPDSLKFHEEIIAHCNAQPGWQAVPIFIDYVRSKTDEVRYSVARAKADLIYCFGSQALGTLVPGAADLTGAELRAGSWAHGDLPVRATYRNTWIASHKGSSSREAKQVLMDLSDALNTGDGPERFKYELFEPQDWRKFLSKFMDSDVTALDYEGSSLEPTMAGFQIGGIGLARKGYAAYLCFKDFGDLDYKLTPDVASAIGRFLKAKNDKGTLLAFNLKYEVPLTKSALHAYIDRVVDVMQECRTLDIRGGLKEISRQLLKVSGWTKDLDEWMENVDKLLGQMKPTSRNGKPAPRAEEKPLREGGIAAVYDGLKVRQAETEKKTPGKVNVRIEAMLAAIDTVREMCRPYYGADSDRKITDFLIYKIDRQDYECNYTEIPKEICGPYCGSDCHNTVEVHEIVEPMLVEKGLKPAASYYNRQIYLGAAMEGNGIMWDDSVAEVLERDHMAVMLSALKGFLSCPGVQKHLTVTDGEAERPFGQQDLVNVLSSTDIAFLKTYFNPSSTQPANTVKLGQILVTPLVRVTMLLQDVNNQYLSNAADAARDFPLLHRLMLAAMKERHLGRGAVSKFLAAFKQVKDAGRLTDRELTIYAQYANYRLPSAESENIQVLMDSLINFTGFDFDDQSTWIDDAKPIYYYKLFKKVSKAVESFLNGKGGRGSVKICQYNAENDSYDRLASYGERPLRDGEIYLYEPRYGVNAAKTKRWTSAYHGIPSMSESKQAFVSRFKNGMGFKCDFSQHELRIIASVCQDANMIQAFVENRDLHKLVATKLYNKAEEEVTDNERAVAKAANFGLVYLKTEETFAQEYMGGDVAGAKRVFRAIFDTFPELEKWRNRCIADLMKAVNGSASDFIRYEIKTLWGDPILHEFNRTKKMEMIDAERYSVNWIIQSTASNLAALALAESDRFLTENRYKTKAFGFTHDCEEFDNHPDEFFLMLTKIPEISERYLFDEFKLPVKIDVEIGQNLGSLVEFKRLKGRTEFMDGEATAKGTLDGSQADVDALIGNLREAGYRVEEATAKVKEKKVSGKDLFSIKGCWHSGIGQTQAYKAVDVEISR